MLGQKIIKIILAECESVEERCQGYREEIRDTLTDIIEAERNHRSKGTNIQQQIENKIHSVGRYLAENSGDKS